ncbi:MAG: hypothetical protein A4C66_03265 [Nitrospira sp. HN-bin3]|nr:MAG: hypothetical protein A4C66_03265 [Nitrospira sp. HN-bin3]
MASTDARPVPIKNTAYRAYFGIFKNDGTLITGATGLDSEVSKDGAAFADCTNEATEISQGLYYLDLSSTEMNADSVLVVVKSTSTGAVPVVLSLYPEETGDINVDVTAFGGTAGTFASGRPEVNTSHFGGTAGTFASGIPAVNATQISGDATAADNIETAFDDTAGAVSWLMIVDQGTAQSISGADLTIRAAAAFGDDVLIGMTCMVHGSTQGYWQARTIVDNVGATDVVTLDSAPTVTPTGTITYKIIGTPPSVTTASVLPRVDVRAFGGTAGTFASGRPEVNTSHFGGTAGTFASGRPEVNTSHIAGSAVSTSSAQIGVNVVNAGGTAWGSGAITAGSIASDAITAAKIATGAIDADAIASDAVTELTTGVLTTQMTEAYAADGVAPTLAQAVFAIQQFLQEKAISGTTLTVKKLDGTTTAMTFTLNDATTPTSVTRAS